MYRTIDCEFWTDDKVRLLPPEQTLLFFYLITNPHSHYSGIYPLSRIIMQYEVRLKQRFSATWEGLLATGLIAYTEPLEQVWVKNMFAHQAKGRKCEKGVATHLKTLHQSPLIPVFLDRYPMVKAYCDDTLLIPYPYPIEGVSSTDSPDPALLITPNPKIPKSNGRTKEKGKTAVPLEWKLSEEDRTSWAKFGLNPSVELAAFKDHALTTDRRCSDWQAAFRNWCRKSIAQKEARK
jgi:hypothetical protein